MRNLALGFLIFASPLMAQASCYAVSQSQDAWPKTDNLVCVQEKNRKFEVTLSFGMPSRALVATYTLDKLSSGCPGELREHDCRRAHYGLANPSNSQFARVLDIQFNGETNGDTGEETGTLSIAGKNYFYRSVR